MDNATLNITPWPIPAGQVDIPYQVQLTATGGVSPYQFRIVQNALPFGLSFNPAGLFNGTVTEPTSVEILIEVRDASSPPLHARQAFDVIFSYGAVVILTTGLPNVVQGENYSTLLQAAAGQTPYHWSLASGALPAGLSLDDAGNITGNTSADTASAFTVQVQDSEQRPSTAQAILALTIVAPSPPPPPPRPPHWMCETDPDLEREDEIGLA